MIDEIIAQLDEGQEQDTAYFCIQKGEAEFEDGTKAKVWQAQLDYYHGETAQSAGGIGRTPDQALIDLRRMVELGKAEERAVVTGDDTLFQIKIGDGAVDLYPLTD